MFMHVQDFASCERQRTGELFDLTYSEMFAAMGRNSANWIATVVIDRCMESRAQEIANLSVDIALAGLQLVIPLDHSAQLSRLTARTIPSSLQSVSRCNGRITMRLSNQQAGLSMGDGALNHFLTTGKMLVDAIGNRVAAFIDGASAFPLLEQAWADAAYWFHEALAEPLDTIAVSKFETAIEVLLRAESTLGSKAIILKAIQAFYSLTGDQCINPQSQLTVEKFAIGLVTDRSRILHGTWSTLNHSLRDSRASLTSLVFTLLSNYALELERYKNLDGTTDNIDDILNSIESHRQEKTN
jgi:hypothetical protein